MARSPTHVPPNHAPRLRGSAIGLALAVCLGLAGACGDVVKVHPETSAGGGGSGVGGGGNHGASGGSAAVGGSGAGASGAGGGGSDCSPSPEECDGLDNDCNGTIDDVPPPDAPCDTGQLGVCAIGLSSCVEGSWICEAVNQPSAEVCPADGLDNDCDGSTDEGLGCPPGYTVACYTGPPNSSGVGICHDGVQTCQPTCTWGPCENDQTPEPEVCDGQDNDCDNYVDEGCAT